MNISLIFSVIVALPKIIGMVKDLILAIERAKEKAKNDGLDKAITDAMGANSVDDIKKANQNITNNLP